MSFFCCLKGVGGGGILSNDLSTFELLGSLSNDHGDGNKNGKKAIGSGPVYMEVGDSR